MAQLTRNQSSSYSRHRCLCRQGIAAEAIADIVATKGKESAAIEDTAATADEELQQQK